MAILLNLKYKSVNIETMPEEEKRKYELTCILPPQLEEGDLEKTKKEIKEIITKSEGTIDFKEEKKHNLAYPINKQGQGIYLISQVSISPEKINNVLNELKIHKQILRHLLTQMPTIKPETKKPRKKPIAKITEEEDIKEEKPLPETPKKKPKEKVKLEEIDKKLNEIIEEI